MENKKRGYNTVAMAECPFCNKTIEAPATVDVIFECPHCHKELITYDKKTESQQRERNIAVEEQKRIKQKKQIFKWICIVISISLFSYYYYTDEIDKQAIHIVTHEYDAAINIEAEKALVKAAVEGDKMKMLEIVGNKQTIHFNKGDRVKIVRDVVRGFPDLYRVERLSDGASGLMPRKYLVKE